MPGRQGAEDVKLFLGGLAPAALAAPRDDKVGDFEAAAFLTGRHDGDRVGDGGRVPIAPLRPERPELLLVGPPFGELTRGDSGQ